MNAPRLPEQRMEPPSPYDEPSPPDDSTVCGCGDDRCPVCFPAANCEICGGKEVIEMQPSTNLRPCPDCSTPAPPEPEEGSDA
jgi:hypothetical protein